MPLDSPSSLVTRFETVRFPAELRLPLFRLRLQVIGRRVGSLLRAGCWRRYDVVKRLFCSLFRPLLACSDAAVGPGTKAWHALVEGIGIST